MINTDIFLTLAVNEMENPSFFPFPFPLHVIFCILATAFLIFRFVTNKKPFQLIIAIAIPLSLTLWISDNRTWYYILGLIELVLLTTAFVTSIIFRDKSTPENETSETTEIENEVHE
ncbi:MAG: hypothetical protein K2J47_04485 [Ruminococcus sp.]|nr:hypothetical protein [Ruminococcus sp.]MDE6788561.1 hypothetical protein [Ruminococcus sp.]